ncbi:MAG: metal-sulfur cluster assembly factor [Thermoplasmata archaeon]|jgi:metal-sulfur cluster biosynthetic enzyme
MVTKEEVLDALKTVSDPEIGVDIVNLGLVYNIDIAEGVVNIRMTMTAPACPVTDWILAEAQRRVEEIPGVKEANIELVWEPPWNLDMISDEARKMLNL